MEPREEKHRAHNWRPRGEEKENGAEHDLKKTDGENQMITTNSRNDNYKEKTHLSTS